MTTSQMAQPAPKTTAVLAVAVNTENEPKPSADPSGMRISDMAAAAAAPPSMAPQWMPEPADSRLGPSFRPGVKSAARD